VDAGIVAVGVMVVVVMVVVLRPGLRIQPATDIRVILDSILFLK